MCEKIVADLIQVATEAKAHYQVWWAIEHHGRASYVRVLNRYVDFFEATRIAHFRAMVMAAWKPFDDKPKASSFQGLLNANPPFLPPSYLVGIQAHLCKRDVVKGLIKLRHLFVAHQNSGLTTEQIFDLASITPFQLRDLINETADLTNQIRRRLGWNNGVFESDRGIESTLKLLAALNELRPNRRFQNDAPQAARV